MCINKILSLFSMSETATPTPVSLPKPGPKTLTIPHPEEPPDFSKTVDNTDLDSTLDEWEIKYNVPDPYRDYWKTKIVIKLDANLPYPAATYELNGIRHLTIKPEWVNPGVIASFSLKLTHQTKYLFYYGVVYSVRLSSMVKV